MTKAMLNYSDVLLGETTRSSMYAIEFDFNFSSFC